MRAAFHSSPIAAKEKQDAPSYAAALGKSLADIWQQPLPQMHAAAENIKNW